MHCFLNEIYLARFRYSEIYSDSSSNHGDDDDEEDHVTDYNENLEMPVDSMKPAKGNYVIVKLCGKKYIRHYVAVVLSDDGSDEYTVKFLKRSSGKSFIFPTKDDISVVDAADILHILDNPTVLDKQETEYCFNDAKLLEFKTLV